MGLGKTMIAAGFGYRRNTNADAIVAAYRAALAAYGIDAADVMATTADKSGEAGLETASRQAGLPLRHFAPEALAAAAERSLTNSAASLAATGLPSLAEAAALAACGAGGRLLGPRIACGPVTCALASTEAFS